MVKARDEAVWFANPAEWRAWLKRNHDTARELWVGLRKAHVPVGLGYKDAVDEALCFGWVDGVTHTVDADGYAIRFTPRTAKSIWSAVNLKRIEELIAEGRMHDAGVRTYEGRDPARAGLYAFEQDEVAFDDEQRARFQANTTAWSWFGSQPPGYRRQATWWVISAKRPKTRARRLDTLIDDSANHRRLKQFAP
jgi:uncharacterized protein YdeI (YjbR/CyaY-like superfamily)